MRPTTTVCLLTDDRIHVVVLQRRSGSAQPLATGTETFAVPDGLLGDHDLESLAEAVANAVADVGRVTGSSTLVVPLQWCFTHVWTPGQRRATYQSLCYDLEQYLPLPLERLTCAFVRLGGNRVLGAAVATAPMQEFLRSLAAHGLEIEHIGVDIVVAGLAGEEDTEALGVAIVDSRWTRALVRTDNDGDVMVTAFASAHSGSLLEHIDEGVQGRFSSDEAMPSRWRTFDLTGEVSGACLETHADCEEAHDHLAGDDALVAVAQAAVAAGSPVRALDLRTGALAANGGRNSVSKLARHCLSAALLLALTATVGMHLQTRAVRTQLAELNVARGHLYRDLFAVDSPPAGAALRLASERIRLEGLTRSQHSAQAQGLPPTESPLETLRNIIHGLPADVCILLLDARLDGRQLTLRGHTARHRDAERIVEAINSVAGVHCRPPRTSRLKAGGVEFFIMATRDELNEPNGTDSF